MMPAHNAAGAAARTWPGGNDKYTQLLLHCDGTNGSTSIIDSSAAARTVTVGGNAQITTSVSKFNGACLSFDGSGDYVTVPDSASLELLGQDFTIDYWFNTNTVAAGTKVMVSRQPVGSGGTVPLVLNQNGTEIWAYLSSNGSSFDIANQRVVATGLSTGSWFHFALSRSGSNWYAFLNGAPTDSFTSSSSLVNGSNPWAFGQSNNVNFNGYMDEIRISVGIARWTAAFTPQKYPYR